MGSEQSSHKKGKSKRSGKDGALRRNKSYDNASICSDSDIPYVSYTANRPISEEFSSDSRLFKWSGSGDIKPKTREKKINREKRDSKARSVGSIVTVKPACEIPTLDKDPLYQRLADIPPFTPIIREKPGIPWTKNPEITEKIDPAPLLRIAGMYFQRVRGKQLEIEARQNRLAHSLQETDALSYHIMMLLSNKEKAFSGHVETFSKIGELSKNLSSCHYALNKTIECMETLNNMLPLEDRLEPFVWTTG